MMIGTERERKEIAASLAKMRGASWTFASQELRDCEVTNAIRAKEMAAHSQAHPVLPQPSVDTSHVRTVVEDDGDPREGLKSALADLTEAEVARDDAREVVDRALQRLATAEADIAEHEGLDERIDGWNIGQVRSGRIADMPYALIAASRERAVATDRLEQAHRAHRTLANELRDAERKVQECQRAASVWAQKCILKRAEQRADDLQRLMDDADAIRADLEALAGCAFPNANGLCQVSASILAALNRPSRERGQHTAMVLEPHKRRWQSMHSELLHDPEA